MNLRPRRTEGLDINLTPLIDVVFLLLIFFMVSTTFRKEAELQLDLPRAAEESAPVEQQQLTVAIDADGRYYVNDKALTDSEPGVLERAMLEVIGDRRDLPVTIRADGRTPHQAVVHVMDTARQLGLQRVGIATVRNAPADDNPVLD